MTGQKDKCHMHRDPKINGAGNNLVAQVKQAQCFCCVWTNSLASCWLWISKCLLTSVYLFELLLTIPDVEDLAQLTKWMHSPCKPSSRNISPPSKALLLGPSRPAKHHQPHPICCLLAQAEDEQKEEAFLPVEQLQPPCSQQPVGLQQIFALRWGRENWNSDGMPADYFIASAD